MKIKKIRKKILQKSRNDSVASDPRKRGMWVYYLPNTENGKRYTYDTDVSYLYLFFVVYGRAYNEETAFLTPLVLYVGFYLRACPIVSPWQNTRLKAAYLRNAARRPKHHDNTFAILAWNAANTFTILFA